MTMYNVVSNGDGRLRALCVYCGLASPPARVTVHGEPLLEALPPGWAQEVYPADYVHWDGSQGSLWTCPRCDEVVQRGGMLRVHPERRAELLRRL